MKTVKKILIIVGIILIGLGIGYSYELSPVVNSNKKIIITIKEGTSTTNIGKILEDNKLIHNKLFFDIYLKINHINNLKASTYTFKQNYGLKKIIELLEKGNTYNASNIKITFKEGNNMRTIAKIIAKKTNNSEEGVLKKATDRAYLQTLINKYWFLTSDILDSNIYYPLEGYLFPDTYEFINTDVSIEDIFTKMLDQENIVLTKYKTNLTSNKYKLQQLITLASITELEGTNLDNRETIASVFYNRLNNNMSLGSDVTTYYAYKINMGDRDLTTNEINTYNPYNTRGPKMEGKIPVGPIANPSEESINAVLHPKTTNYFYFVADKNKNIYFSKNITEHNNTIAKLKSEGLWLTW